jgi:predicted aldo/keto reductase-like oxidoreductase
LSHNSPKSRRDFLKTALMSGAGASLAGSLPMAAAPEAEKSALSTPALTVPRKKLGTTGETIPILLLGGGAGYDLKYDKILHRAIKEGADYIDTALVYANGKSHRSVANFMKQIGNRKKHWITTKGPSENATVESYTKDLDTCLEQLETDYADMYYMHFVDDPRFLDPEFIKMGDRLRKSGKTRFFGFSCHGKRMIEVMNKAARAGGIDSIMFRYSFAKYGDLELNKAMDACRKAGIGLIAMKTQNSVPEDEEHVKKFKSLNFSLHQAKLKAVWADERIDAAVSHIDNTEKLAQNLDAAKSPANLSMSEFRQLQQIATASAGLSCQGCADICEPLIEGEVKVADSLRYLMYKECYGEAGQAAALYSALRPEEKCLDGISFSRASAACPQGIDIARRLEVARQELGASSV